MGLLRAGTDALSGVMSDQWREHFYCEALHPDLLLTKGKKRIVKRGSSHSGEDNIISNGSVIAINEGQCMIIVDQGKIVDFCAAAGEYVYDMSSEPTLLYGDLGKNLIDTFRQIGRRIAFGGETGKDQRVYYFNTKEIIGNKYGTTTPIPFRVVDRNIGLDIDIAIRCHGEYSFVIADPLTFYTNVAGNVPEHFMRQQIAGQLRSELLTALQPALASISAQGVRYSMLPAHTAEIAESLNRILSDKWAKTRGLKIVSFGINMVKASEEDEEMIKKLQKTAVLRNPDMAAAHLVSKQGDAMVDAANNRSARATTVWPDWSVDQILDIFFVNESLKNDFIEKTFAGEHRQGAAASNANPKAQTGQGAQARAASQSALTGQSAQAAADSPWSCSCGTVNRGRFCGQCGLPEAPATGWPCSCGALNKGRFCSECGIPKPPKAPLYQCDQCGWKPEPTTTPPNFCPNCGDVFNENDIKQGV